MLRHAFVALTLSLAVGMPAYADQIRFDGGPSPYGPMYSPSSSPFEAFEWTPLDFAAFSAYGGDFANVRRPVTPVYFFEDPVRPPGERGPDDEQDLMRLISTPVFDEVPMVAQSFAVDEVTPDSVPEPGALMLVGLGLLGVSTRLRRAYRNR